MKILAIVLLAACAEQSSYLGAELPKACADRDAERCISWMAARDLGAGSLDTYNDPQLVAYVQQVVGRLAKGSQLAAAPDVQIANHDASYATLGGRIVIGRPTIQRLGSEAELAAVLAHELAHLEGQHANTALVAPRSDDEYYAQRRDAEAVADERAVVLLERAGYKTDAMARALDRILEADDAEHPPREQRIARVRALATDDEHAFEGSAQLAKHLVNTVSGRDTRLGMRVDDAWVVGALGIAFDLGDDTVKTAEDVLTLEHGHTVITAYAIGSAWAKELAASLGERREVESELGPLATGVVNAPASDDDTPIGKVESSLKSTLPQPTAGTQIAILDRGRGALLVEVTGPRVPGLHLRAATAAELAAAQPKRIAAIETRRGE